MKSKKSSVTIRVTMVSVIHVANWKGVINNIYFFFRVLLLLHIKRNDVFCEAFLVPSIGKLDVTFHTYLIFFADVFVCRWRAVAVTITGKFCVAFVFFRKWWFFVGFYRTVYLSWLKSRWERVCLCNKEWIGSEMNGKIIMIENCVNL